MNNANLNNAINLHFAGQGDAQPTAAQAQAHAVIVGELPTNCHHKFGMKVKLQNSLARDDLGDVIRGDLNLFTTNPNSTSKLFIPYIFVGAARSCECITTDMAKTIEAVITKEIGGGAAVALAGWPGGKKDYYQTWMGLCADAIDAKVEVIPGMAAPANLINWRIQFVLQIEIPNRLASVKRNRYDANLIVEPVLVLAKELAKDLAAMTHKHKTLSDEMKQLRKQRPAHTPPAGGARDRSPPRERSPRRKTIVCIPWVNGSCTKGAACSDAHAATKEKIRFLHEKFAHKFTVSLSDAQKKASD
jgi:hypothetical protein